jgi:hypothetical protein
MDYSLFSFYESNRPAEHWPKIAKSIAERNLTPYVPVVCSRHEESGALMVVDGQNRLKACESLGLPVFYVVLSGGSEDDIQRLNQYQKNWSIENYLDYFVAKNYPHYVVVKQLLDEMPELRIGYVLRLWQAGNLPSVSETFRSGDYTMPVEAQHKIRSVYRVYQACKSASNEGKIVNMGSLFSAIGAAILHPACDKNTLIEQIQKYGYMIGSRADHTAYKGAIEEVYNFRKRNKVSFKY